MAFNPFNWLWGLFSLDIGIDLGTANTLVHVRGKGIVINEPSWVAIDKRTKEPLAIGSRAKEMAGRAPSNVIVIRPMRDGVISEFDITKAMLGYFISKAHQQSIVPMPRPRVVVGIPQEQLNEKLLVYDAAMAQSQQVYLLKNARCSLVQFANFRNPRRMIVDIGGAQHRSQLFRGAEL